MNIRWTTGIGIAVVAVVLGGGLPATGHPAADRSAEDPAFRKLDADRDGFVSREEAKQWRDSAAAFSETDQDRDGRLNRDEFIKFHSLY
ncbi:MAG: EF-hand domain-containing protein [Betaproteobacteria bacterium]|nr:EF-hand domain-containing protein [Betaproteobacteria bacterium]